MANDVFANGREVSCKVGSGKSTAAFPDVCFTPPQTPGTPAGAPTPYPNTSMDSDTSSGSKNVKIGGKEVMLKNISYFKKSAGDEAGNAPKKGFVTSTNRGKVYFSSWSMNVKFESENVVRHLDVTTHNHASANANEAAPWPQVSKMGLPELPPKPCNTSCPKEPSKERYEKLRNGSPTKPARKKLKAQGKKCATCKTRKGTSPDHIVPLKKISQMPGFACLSEDDQKKIANYPDNFVGLCRSCNSSKSDTLWQSWKGHKKRGLKWPPELREKGSEISSNLINNLEAEIRKMECG